MYVYLDSTCTACIQERVVCYPSLAVRFVPCCAGDTDAVSALLAVKPDLLYRTTTFHRLSACHFAASVQPASMLGILLRRAEDVKCVGCWNRQKKGQSLLQQLVDQAAIRELHHS